jgi:hypothetical protein
MTISIVIQVEGDWSIASHTSISLGVERSSSEKSVDAHEQSKRSSSATLSFSKLFVTSVADKPTIRTTSSHYQPLLDPELNKLKPILKKNVPNSIPSERRSCILHADPIAEFYSTPEPIPRRLPKQQLTLV